MQIPQESAHAARECMKGEADTTYNLSHTNIVNTLSHEMKCSRPANTAKHATLTLYLIQARCCTMHELHGAVCMR